MEIGDREIRLPACQPAGSSEFGILTHRNVRTHGNCYRTSASTQIDYQNYSYLLTEEIYNRKGKKTRFTEVELWFLIYSLSQARQQAISLG